MVYHGKQPATIKLADNDGNRLLAYCLSRIPEASFRGPDAQEELGDLVNDTGPVAGLWDHARRTDKEEGHG